MPQSKSSYKRVQPDRRKSSWLSEFLFYWMNPVFKTGNKRQLDKLDLLPLQEQDEVEQISRRLRNNWENEVDRTFHDHDKGNRLWNAIFKTIDAPKLILAVVLMAMLCITCASLPFVLVAFLFYNKYRYFFGTEVWVTAIALPLVALAKGLFFQHSYYLGQRFGMQMRAAVSGIIYTKILRTGKGDLTEFQTGHVMNLLSNDVQKLDESILYFLRACFAPFSLFLTSAYLCYVLGASTVTGIIICIVMIPVMLVVFILAGKIRFGVAATSDTRIGMVTEAVAGIREVKSQALEDKFLEKIHSARKTEMRNILKKNLMSATVTFIVNGFPILFTMGLMLTLILIGKELNLITVFVVLTSATALRDNYLLVLMWGFSVAEAKASMKRVEVFLDLPDMEPLVNQEMDEHEPWKPKHNGLKMTNVCSATDGDLEGPDLLINVTLDVKCGELVTITGPVGCGKSSLLYAITDELSHTSGTIACSGKIVHVPQAPWIFAGTLRDNIVFNHRYNGDWFKKVIEACQLEEDVNSFPEGDNTVVGEKGAVLSGGQQSRVSLARAVYTNADVYLLDDPLSAVDDKVGSKIFDKCINGLLAKKTRLLVTHNIDIMKASDQVVILEAGSVVENCKWSDENDEVFMEKLSAYTSTFNLQSQSLDGEGAKDKSSGGLTVAEEARQSGRVSVDTYWQLLRAGSSIPKILLLLVLSIAMQVGFTMPDIWLTALVRRGYVAQQRPFSRNMYAIICVIGFTVVALWTVLFYYMLNRSSIQLHKRMVNAILHAPVHFFDSSPVGRIINRFSKDVGGTDEMVPLFVINACSLMLGQLTAVIIPAIFNYYVLIVSVPTVLIFIWFTVYYLKGSRELRRLDAVCRSPLFSHAAETLEGLETIRNHRMQSIFIKRFHKYQDQQNQAFLMCLAGQRWMGLRAELVSSFLILTVSIAGVLIKQDPALAALSLTYALQMGLQTQYMVQMFGDAETNMTSVERVIEYTKLDRELGYDTKQLPPDNWPTAGRIVLESVDMRYYPGGPRILKGVTCDFGERAKVGIVGRTGAGKSSLVAALLRMPEAEGGVTIDGVDISQLNLQESRKRVTLLSQTPVLFRGTIRENLDPFNEYTDDEIWTALLKAQLQSSVRALEGGLKFQLSEEGANFSLGQKQLFCLARALLRKTKILILDEPTAHVDPKTEVSLQEKLRYELRDCAVLTIAHRLNTLADCNTMLVLDSGRVAEYGNTEDLLKKDISMLGLENGNNEQ